MRSIGWFAPVEEFSCLNKALSSRRACCGEPGLRSAEPLLAITLPSEERCAGVTPPGAEKFRLEPTVPLQRSNSRRSELDRDAPGWVRRARVGFQGGFFQGGFHVHCRQHQRRSAVPQAIRSLGDREPEE